MLGWKEFELEVVRDRADNAIIVCSIENVDPMGVHTGNSITVAPALTLTDKEYQRLRTASIAVLREIGVETGGSNVQFAINPADGRMVVIEMNPRVSRSSALASKATGFPIAKIAAKLAVGYTLDELTNDITRVTPASFEPTIDYVVTKIPRFAFEKFPGADPVLTTSMKSVGEVMAIGRTFAESVQKALRSMETGLTGFDDIAIPNLGQGDDSNAIRAALGRPTPDRLRFAAQALRLGVEEKELSRITGYDPWFVGEIAEIVRTEAEIKRSGLPHDADGLRRLKAMGFSDARLATLAGKEEHEVARARAKLGVHPVYKRIDTCAAEFAALTSYMYSTYEAPVRGDAECEARPSDRRKVIILGGGPNRIGQGIEFDYCCCHACFSLSEQGFETIMINCNPETVSTDYDTSDRLYFEPLTAEDVLEIIRVEEAKGTLAGVIVQFGGQTPLKLAGALGKAGVPILGTSADAIDLAEDRKRFQELLTKLDLKQPKNGTALDVDTAVAVARGDRLSGDPASLLRARRPRHDHRRRRAVAEIGAEIGRAVPHLGRQSGADRRLPAPRDRDRRRCDLRCGRPGVHRRDHGAHRRGRHPFRRFGLRAAAAFDQCGDDRRDRTADDRARARAQCARTDERAIRHPERRDLRARSQSAGVAHGAVRGQGDRASGRRHRVARDGGRAPVLVLAQAVEKTAYRGEGSGAALRAIPRRRHHPRPGDEIDRRGHGARFRFRPGVREGPDRRRQQAAAGRNRVHLGQGCGQGVRRRARRPAHRHGFRDRGDARNARNIFRRPGFRCG